MTTAIAKMSAPALEKLRGERRRQLAMVSLKKRSAKAGRAAFLIGFATRPLAPTAIAQAYRSKDPNARSLANGQVASHLCSGIAKLLRGGGE